MSVRNEEPSWQKLEAVLEFGKFASPNLPFKIQSTIVCQRVKTPPSVEKEKETSFSKTWPKQRENVGICRRPL